MTPRSKLIVGLAALCIAGAVAAKTIFRPGEPSPSPVKALPRAASVEFDHSHRLLNRVLEANVKDGRVDYKALKAAPADLIAYLGELASVGQAEFDSWDENQQLAMLINLYNAATLKLIIDHYPLEGIKDIGGIFKKPWDIESLTLFGENTTLNHIEHEILRKNYTEPRIHFAIVCAAKGCPDLRPDAFTPYDLDAQLREQGEKFLRDTSKNNIDSSKQTIYLSKIFSWFKDDFKKGGSVIDFVRPYFPEEQSKTLNNDFRIKYTSYDWSLNEQ